MVDAQVLSEGIMPHTRAALSSRSRVFGRAVRNKLPSPGGLELVGVISNFGVSSSRNIEPLRGIGLGDHIVEMVPGQSDPVELSITKFALSMANMFQEFGYGGGVDGIVRALKHHRYPVDIKHELLISGIADDFGSANVLATQDHIHTPTQVQGHGTPVTGGFSLGDNLITNQFKVIITWFEGCWFQSYSVSYPVDSAAITEDATVIVTDVSGNKSGDIVLPYDANEINRNKSMIWFNKSFQAA